MSASEVRRGSIACAFFIALVATPACNLLSSCDVGASRCNGNTLEVCQPGSDSGDEGLAPWWENTPCPVACEALTSGAYCVDSTTPVEACANVSDGKGACWNGSVTSCEDGYPVGTESGACAAEGGVCIVAGATALCTESSTPSALCANLSNGGSPSELPQVCDGADQVQCVSGYIVARTSCAAVCVVDNGQAFCAESAMPDPVCASSSSMSSLAICDGADQVQCEDGYLVSRTTCASPTRCTLVERAGVTTTTTCTTPDPGCGDGSFQIAGYCSGNTAYVCQDNYVISETDCGSDGTSTCSVGSSGATCQ